MDSPPAPPREAEEAFAVNRSAGWMKKSVRLVHLLHLPDVLAGNQHQSNQWSQPYTYQGAIRTQQVPEQE